MHKRKQALFPSFLYVKKYCLRSTCLYKPNTKSGLPNEIIVIKQLACCLEFEDANCYNFYYYYMTMSKSHCHGYFPRLMMELL